MTLCTGQGNSPEIEDGSKLNSFGMKVELDRKPQENVGMSVKYLLLTKKHLEVELQDLSSDTNVESDEKNFKLPPTLGELKIKYLQELASMRQPRPLPDFGNPESTPLTLHGEGDSLLGEEEDVQSLIQGSNLSGQRSEKEHDKIVCTSIGIGPISKVKKYLEQNIRALRLQLAQNEWEIQREPCLRTQGTHMTHF